MTDANVHRPDADGVDITAEQHAAPSAPAVGEPALPFSDGPVGGATRASEVSAGYPQPTAPGASGTPPQPHVDAPPRYTVPGAQQGQGAPRPPQFGGPAQPQYAQSAPMSPMDEKNAGMWGHLSGLSGVVTSGFGGWIGPLVVYLMYKDRSPFAKQEAKEALNFGILTAIVTIGIIVVGFVLALLTFGLGAAVWGLWWLPWIAQAVLAIIGGVRVSNGGSYRYPLNWRLVR